MIWTWESMQSSELKLTREWSSAHSSNKLRNTRPCDPAVWKGKLLWWMKILKRMAMDKARQMPRAFLPRKRPDERCR